MDEKYWSSFPSVLHQIELQVNGWMVFQFSACACEMQVCSTI